MTVVGLRTRRSWTYERDELAIAALVVSLLSIAISAFASHRTDLRARMPVLVFVYNTQTGWILRNVKNGQRQ